MACAKPYFGIPGSTKSSGTPRAGSTAPDDSPRIAADLKEALQVRQRLDVARLAGVDGVNRHLGHRETERDISGDHLDLEPKAVFVTGEQGAHESATDESIAGLVVDDLPADRGREEPAAKRVRQPPHRRHRREVPTPDDELGVARIESGEECRDLARIVLPIGIQGHDRVGPMLDGVPEPDP